MLKHMLILISLTNSHIIYKHLIRFENKNDKCKVRLDLTKCSLIFIQFICFGKYLIISPGE